MLILCVAFCLAFALVSSASSNRQAAKARKSPMKPKIQCHVCQAVGTDCQSNKVSNTCDKCAKIVGIANDPDQVPPMVWSNLDPGAKEAMRANKGKQMAFRGCATRDLIDLAEFGTGYASDDGCSDFDDFFGFKDATACLCSSDC